MGLRNVRFLDELCGWSGVGDCIWYGVGGLVGVSFF